jgi:hypothetical protein
MPRYTKHPKPSPETREEAMKIARGTQRPGQAKEQTKLIAQGIQMGIDQYKKQQKAKARELDKHHRHRAEHKDRQGEQKPSVNVVYRQHWLPWLLLVVSWVAFAVYVILFP